MVPGVCRRVSSSGNLYQIYYYYSCIFLILAANQGHCFAPALVARNPRAPKKAAAAATLGFPASSRCGLFSAALRAATLRLSMSSSSPSSSSAESPRTSVLPSWSDLQTEVGSTAVGTSLNEEVALRKTGQGSAHVHNTLRRFAPSATQKETGDTPAITVYRDHAGWCVVVCFAGGVFLLSGWSLYSG